MLNFYKSKIVWALFFCGVIFIFHSYFTRRTTITSPKSLIYPIAFRNFTFGFSEQTADTLWIRSLQDFDFCEQKIAENVCRGQGWLFQMLNLVIELSPHFRIPNAVGPLALSVIVSDIQGASMLFDKSVVNFPKDVNILYRAAYHAMEEEKNYAKAADLMQRAAQNGGPPWFYALAGRLYTKEGRKDLAETVYKDISQDPNLKEAAERLRRTIDSRAE